MPLTTLRSHPTLALAALAATLSLGAGQDPAPLPRTPEPSAGHSLVYHDELRSVLLVNAGLGGMTSPPSTSPTILWRWTGSAWTVLDSAGPPVRNLGGVAYDAHRGALVLYGGSYDQNLVYGDVWEWKRDAGWTRRDASGPDKRDHVEMVYDAERRRVVLFGGQIGPKTFPDDTWTWDGSTWLRVATTGPPGRVHHGMLYDEATRRVLLVGGSNPSTGTLGDTWAWNGSAWSSAAAAIQPRSHARLGRTAGGVVLLGGFPATPTLRLQGDAWVEADPTAGPSPRYLTAMAFDPSREVTVLFGGGDPEGNDLFGDTWECDGTGRWAKR